MGDSHMFMTFLRSYKLLEIERPAYGAPASCHREVPEGRLVERRADASGARALLDVLRPLRLTRFSQQGASMGDMREQCGRLHEQGQLWLKRERSSWAWCCGRSASRPSPRSPIRGCLPQCPH